ncbi:unnamed protein product [Prorocentrum cordatum]|uniref:Uncharacterized protein n=1 Tax=Prorocentrum cordatum TaxID=2364126 RepID=A0ABN9YCY5_9DINO|nr:unnamed protein product [Polarella glacialis]
MANKGVACLVLVASAALPLQALTLHEADEALLRRAGQGAAAGEAGRRSGMVDLQHLVDQHAASEVELHARAAETFRKFASKMAKSGCNYKGGLFAVSQRPHLPLHGAERREVQRDCGIPWEHYPDGLVTRS